MMLDYLVEYAPELNLARQRRSEILMNLGDWEAAEIELRTLLSQPTRTHHGISTSRDLYDCYE